MVDCSTYFAAILDFVGNAREGLTKSVFLFVSQLTPMVNVDLLIKNELGQTLLTWRDDEFYQAGWHVPGGVIRFKELAQTRIQLVAKSELEATVKAETSAMCVNELMAAHRDVRGHFISLLYRCYLTSDLDATKAYQPAQALQNGNWKWHDGCPKNIIAQHEVYRQYM